MDLPEEKPSLGVVDAGSNDLPDQSGGAPDQQAPNKRTRSDEPDDEGGGEDTKAEELEPQIKKAKAEEEDKLNNTLTSGSDQDASRPEIGTAQASPSITSILDSLAPAAASAAQVQTGDAKNVVSWVIADSAFMQDKPDESPRKRKPQPIRKILFARKERAYAAAVLMGKVDLVTVLPMNDCLFLAENFWIFTAEQLYLVVRSDGIDGPTVGTWTEPNIENLKNRILAKLTDHIVEEKKSGQHGSTDHVSEDKVEGGDASDGMRNTKEEPMISKQEQNDEESKVTEESAIAANAKTEGEQVVTVVNAASSVTDQQHEGDHTVSSETNSKNSGNESAMREEAALEAKARLDEWEQTLKQTPTGDAAHSYEEAFYLTGPLKVLLPLSLRNFLASVQIDTLFSFFSLKRTETGAICDLYKAWRHKCGMPALPQIALAKHLLAISFRLETAVSTVPCVTQQARKWMNDPIVILTGAAREFLVDDLDITTASKFLETRTKALSILLVEWREKKRLPPLRGSGKVAMISGWKACVRECYEAEGKHGRFGRILPKSDLDTTIREFEVTSEKSESGFRTQSNGPSKKKKKAAAEQQATQTNTSVSSDRQVAYALHSALFMEDVLGESSAKVVTAAGVKTAAELLDNEFGDDSELCRKVIENKLVDDVAEFHETLQTWRERLKEHLEKMRGEGAMKETVKIGKSTSPSKAKLKPKRRRKPFATTKVDDPYLALSDVTRSFLKTMGIASAHEFLSTRSTDIANEFVKWRIAEGKPELRGLGAIASVSGWKAICRNAAKDLGMLDLAELEPDSKSTWKSHAKISSSEAPTERESNLQPKVKPEDNRLSFGVNLGGKTTRSIAVQNPVDSKCQFRFELSLRHGPSNEADLYLMYDGAGPSVKSPSIASKVEEVQGTKVLATVPQSSRSTVSLGAFDLHKTFKTLRSDCGLIELQQYGVRPVRNQDLTLLKTEIKNFVKYGHVAPISLEESSTCNIILRRVQDFTYQFLLFIDSPMEKGQATCLAFPSAAEALYFSDGNGKQSSFYDSFLTALNTLSLKDLRQLHTWLHAVAQKELTFLDCAPTCIKLATEGNASGLKQSFSVGRRIHWLSNQIVSLITNRLASKSTDAFYRHNFGPERFFGVTETQDLTPEAVGLLREVIGESFRCEIMETIRTNPCWHRLRNQEWCGLTEHLFDGIIDNMSKLYSEQTRDIELYLANQSELLGKCFSTTPENNLEDFIIKGGALEEADVSGADRYVVIRGSDTATDAQDARLHKIEADEDVSKSIYVEWYRKSAWSSATIVLRALDQVLMPSEKGHFDCQKMTELLNKAAGIEDDDLDSTSLHEQYESLIYPVSTPSRIPSTSQFFLGLVWPVLRTIGWHMDAGEAPEDVVFVAPAMDTQKRQLVRNQNIRERAKIARELEKLDLKRVSKATKRLMNELHQESRESEGNLDKKLKYATVHETLKKYLSELEGSVESKMHIDRLRAVVDKLICCFNDIAPKLVDGRNNDAKSSEAKPSEVLQVDTLLKFLLVMPSILRQSGLNKDELNDSIDVISDLTEFVVSHQEDLFGPENCPSKEVYDSDGIPAPRLMKKIDGLDENTTIPIAKELAGNDGQGEILDLKHLITDDDRKALTDFFVLVMEQIIPCRATQADVARKSRKIHQGFPGLMCRHCAGVDGEGRYFYASLESLATASTVFEKHLLRCRSVSSELKSSVEVARARHSEQKKELPTGAQQAFFTKLWHKLMTSRISVAPSVVLVDEEVEEAEVISQDSETIEFTDHVRLLDFVRTTAPWKANRALQTALGQYYGCIDYGGRIYQTNSMPKHFSPEWLLAKVVPKRHEKQRKNMPG